MSSEYQAPESVADIDQRELQLFQQTEVRPIGVIGALDYCLRLNINVPKSVLAEAIEIICTLLERERAPKGGRNAGLLARYRQHMRDFERFSVVEEVREQQKVIAGQVSDLSALTDAPPALLEDRKKMAAWTGKTGVHAYRVAGRLLRGTAAHADPETIKRSWMKVIASGREGTAGKRYVLLPPWLRRRLGVDFESKEVKKPRPLFDLKL